MYSAIKRRRKHPRPGTKYPVVDGVMKFPDGREVCNCYSRSGQREYDRRRLDMAKRQNFLCAISGADLRLWGAQFDHQNGRGSKGSIRDDRIEVDGRWFNAALTPSANTAKGSRRYRWIDGKYIPAVSPEQAELAHITEAQP